MRKTIKQQEGYSTLEQMRYLGERLYRTARFYKLPKHVVAGISLMIDDEDFDQAESTLDNICKAHAAERGRKA